jgi:hypothetical protein
MSLDVPPPPKASAVVIKQFRKAAKKLYKNLRLTETIYSYEIGFLKYVYPVRKEIRNRFGYL